VEIKLILEKKIMELMKVYSVKNIRNAGLGTERMSDY